MLRREASLTETPGYRLRRCKVGGKDGFDLTDRALRRQRSLCGAAGARQRKAHHSGVKHAVVGCFML